MRYSWTRSYFQPSDRMAGQPYRKSKRHSRGDTRNETACLPNTVKTITILAPAKGGYAPPPRTSRRPLVVDVHKRPPRLAVHVMTKPR